MACTALMPAAAVAMHVFRSSMRTGERGLSAHKGTELKDYQIKLWHM